MKKQSPKQKLLHTSILLSYCIIVVCFFAFISCNHQASPLAQIDTDKKPQPINSSSKDSFAAPRVVPITAANQPKVIKAGKPIIRIDLSNGGAPFFTNYSTEIKVSKILTMQSVRHCF